MKTISCLLVNLDVGNIIALLLPCIVTDDVLRSTDNNFKICLVLLHFSKAFDTLDHETLIKKLSNFGASNNAISFFILSLSLSF